MSEVRKFVKADGTEVDVLNLQTGDVFDIFEVDGELIGTFQATSPGFLHEGVPAIAATPWPLPSVE